MASTLKLCDTHTQFVPSILTLGSWRADLAEAVGRDTCGVEGMKELCRHRSGNLTGIGGLGTHPGFQKGGTPFQTFPGLSPAEYTESSAGRAGETPASRCPAETWRSSRRLFLSRPSKAKPGVELQFSHGVPVESQSHQKTGCYQIGETGEMDHALSPRPG